MSTATAAKTSRVAQLLQVVLWRCVVQTSSNSPDNTAQQTAVAATTDARVQSARSRREPPAPSAIGYTAGPAAPGHSQGGSQHAAHHHHWYDPTPQGNPPGASTALQCSLHTGTQALPASRALLPIQRPRGDAFEEGTETLLQPSNMPHCRTQLCCHTLCLLAVVRTLQKHTPDTLGQSPQTQTSTV